ncbi:MAG: AEC family transporter [Burkholderiaceae bacterium]
MSAVLTLTLPVFGLVFCGFAGARGRLLPEHSVAGLNAFVFWFALPAMLFRVISANPLQALLDARFITGYLLATLGLFAAARAAGRRGWIDPARSDGRQATADAMTCAHGNVGYLGLALVAEIGQQYLPTVALTILCEVFVLIAIAVALLEKQRHPQARGWRIALTIGTGLVRSPLIASIALGLLVAALGWPMPPVIDNFLRLLGNAAGPCALFAIGATLGVQRVSLDRATLVLVIAKLLIHPLLAAIALYWLIPVSPSQAAAGVLCATLPAGANNFIVAQRYGADTTAISAALLLGTFAALATVSVAIVLLGLA